MVGSRADVAMDAEDEPAIRTLDCREVGTCIDTQDRVEISPGHGSLTRRFAFSWSVARCCAVDLPLSNATVGGLN